MGMYTELYLAVELSKDTPEDIVKWIGEGSEEYPTRISNFGYSTSYYFDGIAFKKFKFDDIADCFYLTTRFDIRNYDDEIEFLLDKLTPYITSEGHIGHIRYESDLFPTILYMDTGFMKKVKDNK